MLENSHLPERTLRGIYAEEMLRLSWSIIQLCEKLFAVVAPQDTGLEDWTLTINPDFANYACQILAQCAALKKLFVTSPDKKKRETSAQYLLRIERAAALARHLEPLAIPTIRQSTARNMVEHFDEYMDGAVINDAKKKYEWLLHGCAIKDFSMVPPNAIPLKIYSIRSRTFHHFTSVVDIGKVYEEAKQVYQLLLSKYNRKHNESPTIHRLR